MIAMIKKGGIRWRLSAFALLLVGLAAFAPAPAGSVRAEEAGDGISAEAEQEIAAFKAAHARFVELYQANRYDEAEAEGLKALAIARKLLGGEHLITATELNNMAALYTSMGRYEAAAPLFADALAIRRKLLPADDPNILSTLEDQQVMLMALGRADEERAALEAMLPFYDGEPPRNAERLAYVLDRLGVLDIRAGDYATARRRLENALALYRAVKGDDDLRAVTSRSNLAVVDVKEGQLDAALDGFGKVLEARRRLLGETDEATLQTMAEIAGIYDQQNLHDQAMATASAIMRLREQALGADDARLAGDHNRLSAYAYRAGNHDLAGSELAVAIEIAEKHGDADNPELLTYLANLATLLEEIGAYDRAESVYRRRLAILEKKEGERSAAVVDAIASLGALNRQLVRYDEAERLFFDALGRESKAQRGERAAQPMRIGNIHNHIAGLYREVGRYDDAEQQYKTVETLYAEDRSTPPEEMAKLFDNIGVLNVDLDRLDAAEAYHKRALALFEAASGLDGVDIALCLNNLATVYHLQRRQELALPLYRRALALYETKARASDPLIGVLNDNIAGAYRYAGDYVEAETYYRRALEALVKAHGEEHPEVALARSNFATFYAERGDFESARKLFAKALEIAQRTLGPDHPRIAHILRLAGENEMNLGDYQAAGRDYERALQIAETVFGPDHETTGRILNNLAALELWQQDYDAALVHYRRAARIEEARLRHKQAKSEDEAFAKPANDLFTGLAISLWFVAEKADAATRAQLREEALAAMQRSQASSAGTALAQMSARFAAGDGALAAAVRERQDLVRRHTRLDAQLIETLGTAPGKGRDEAVASLREKLRLMEARIDELDGQLQRDFPDYATLADPQPLDSAAIREQLGRDEALLLLITSNEAVYELVVTKDGIDWRRQALQRSRLRDLVGKLRCGLDSSNWTDPSGWAVRTEWQKQAKTAQQARRDRCIGLIGKAYAEDDWSPFDFTAAGELYDKLLGPVEAAIRGKSLLVVAADVLTGLPLQVLVSGTVNPALRGLDRFERAHWLIRDHAVTTLPSVASLKALRGLPHQAQRAERPLAGFADPEFWQPSHPPAQLASAAPVGRSVLRGYGGFFVGRNADPGMLANALPQLEGTRRELTEVGKILRADGADLHLGRAASETAVKAAPLDKYRIVYFATHGLVAGDVEGVGEPALAFSLPDRASPEDDGLLTASEVTTLVLNADWVVMSACNTAAADKPGAEALSGLARAFFYAGARTLLVSHWPVGDQAAVDLTTGAFKEMEADPKRGRAEALRRSMLALIGKGGGNAHPTTWAPFVVVGEGAAR
jgi:CHAT domain-containing protein/Tfp pilus assembly protein PilF